jgi:hypothetical protein
MVFSVVTLFLWAMLRTFQKNILTLSELWIWRQYDLSKRQHLPINSCGITTQKTTVLVLMLLFHPIA